MKKRPSRPVRPFRTTKGSNKLIESASSAYEPDKEFAPKMTEALVPKFYQAITVEPKRGQKPVDLVESANIIEVNRFGAYRVRKIEGSDDFRAAMKESKEGASVLRAIISSGIKLREASKFTAKDKKALREVAKSSKFREDFSVSSGNNDPFNEFIPLMGGPFSHQLYLHDYLDMLAKAFEAWNHNPLAHQIVKITTIFVLGRGITFKAANPLVQVAFMKWWDKNDMSQRLEHWSDMLSRDGELIIRRFFNTITKEMFVRWVDPSTIWEIVTDLEDIETVYYYHQQYPTAYQVLYGAPHGAKFDPTKFGSSKYVINQIPAEEITHIKINCSPNEKRGRSDFFSILGWLKRYKDFQTAIVLRAIIQSTFAWKNKLQGTDTDVDAFINQFGTDQPEFGSVWVENEASDLQPMTADVKNGAGLSDCPGIVNAISVGSGIAKEYLGNTEHATRAGAVVASEPSAKKFQSRQLLLGRLLKDLAQHWITNEIVSGRIPGMTFNEDTGKNGPTDGSIEFQFPEIAVEDRSSKLADIETTQQAGYISKRRAATMSAKELGIEGYDFDSEQEEITDEGISSMSSLYPGAGAAPAPGTPPDAASAVRSALGRPSNPRASAPPIGPKKAGGLSGKEKGAIKNNDRR